MVAVVDVAVLTVATQALENIVTKIMDKNKISFIITSPCISNYFHKVGRKSICSLVLKANRKEIEKGRRG